MKFEHMLFKEHSSHKNLLLISHISNIILISIFIMISTGVSDTTNVSLSSNDMTQTMGILASVISVSIVVILFFQWAIIMIFRGLYNSRKVMNINIRLLGLGSKELKKLYIKEILSMQKLAIPIGIVLSFLIYYCIAIVLKLDTKILNGISAIGSIIIHLGVSLVAAYIILSVYCNVNVVDELRGDFKRVNGFKFNKVTIIRIILSILVLCLIIGKRGNITDSRLYALSGVLYIIPFILGFDIVLVVLEKVIISIAKKLKLTNMIISENISLNYFKRERVVFMLIVLSTTLFIGLQMVFTNVRAVASEVVSNNINYEGMLSYDKFNSVNKNKNENYFMGTNIKVKDESGSNLNIYGIDSDYLNKFEKIVIDKNKSDITYDDLVKNVSDKNWNGIILPQFYISKEDIGKKLTFYYENKKLEFIVQGSYYSNNFDQLTCFVSKGYINSILGEGNNFNTIYLKDNNLKPNLVKTFGNSTSYTTKDEIDKASVNHAVQGTELVELTTAIVVMCSIIVLINIISMNSKQNINDMVKFRALGLYRESVIKIYCIQVIGLITRAFIVGIIFAIGLAKIGCYTILDKYYFISHFDIIWGKIIMLYALMVIISVIVVNIFSLKIIKNEHVELLRDFNQG